MRYMCIYTYEINITKKIEFFEHWIKIVKMTKNWQKCYEKTGWKYYGNIIYKFTGKNMGRKM